MLIGITLFCRGASGSERVAVHVLGFITPCSNSALDLERMQESEVFDLLATRTGYDFKNDQEFQMKEFTSSIAENGGVPIGHPISRVSTGEEVETSFVYPVICRRTDPSGMQQEWESTFEESPGIRLVLTPWQQEGEAPSYRVDYRLDLALNSGDLAGDCPELVRFTYRDSLVVVPEKWHIIGMSIIEDTGTGGMYEVWLLTRLESQ